MPTPRKTTATKRKPAAATKTNPEPVQAKPEPTEEERTALLTAYSSLKSAGLPVPEDIATQVEGWIAEEEKRREAEAAEYARIEAELAEENAKGPWFVRNGYSAAPLSIRLDRQTEKRRVELKPRGMPGDMHPLEDNDLKDPILQRNVRIGVCEVIPAGQANRILAQQTNNMTSRVHTPTAILRNAQGKPYEGDFVKTELEFNAQGVTVGVVNPDQIQGGVEDKAVARDGGVVRVNQQREVASQFIPTGGNPHVVQTGPVNVDVPSLDPVKAKIADDLARRKRVEGPQAALSGMQVTVNPVQKS